MTKKFPHKTKLTIEQMRTLAKKNGGQCLSKSYINGLTKLTWQCKKGHRWKASPQSVKHMQTWCPKCAGRIHDIKYFKKLAKTRGGRCLSKVFLAVTKKLTWQCDIGHKWDARPAAIKQGAWCPTCNHPSFSIKDMQSFAKKYKGLFISKKYKGYRDKHKWQCKKGHVFKDTHENIKRRDYFCKKCKTTS